MLVVATTGVLRRETLPSATFAHSPEAIIAGTMDDNFIDFNVAKMKVLFFPIIDAPIVGAPRVDS